MAPAGARFNALLAQWRAQIGTVPDPAAWVCSRCHGPCDPSYSYCYGCMRVFGSAPDSLRTRVVPLTSTFEEGPWYAQLVSYKTTSLDPWPLLGGLITRYATIHAKNISALLGGAPTAITVVPSKRGRPMQKQPLYRVLASAVTSSPGALPDPAMLLEYTGTPVLRQSYTPSAFRVPAGYRVKGARVVLVEDSWTSGATAVSAAGALLEGGAKKVVILPIARLMKSSFWGNDHPYIKAMKAPYDIGHWPRSE